MIYLMVSECAIILRVLTESDILLTIIQVTQVTEWVLLREADKPLSLIELNSRFFPLVKLVYLLWNRSIKLFVQNFQHSSNEFSIPGLRYVSKHIFLQWRYSIYSIFFYLTFDGLALGFLSAKLSKAFSETSIQGFSFSTVLKFVLWLFGFVFVYTVVDNTEVWIELESETIMNPNIQSIFDCNILFRNAYSQKKIFGSILILIFALGLW